MQKTARCWLYAISLVAACGAGAALAVSPEAADPWPDLVRDVFDGRPLAEGTGVIAIEMPARAEDAAIVPVTMRLSLSEGRSVRAVTLVIDQNPAPVARDPPPRARNPHDRPWSGIHRSSGARPPDPHPPLQSLLRVL